MQASVRNDPLPVTLRRATVQDAAAFARLMGDPTVYSATMQLPYASEEVWHQRLTDNLLPTRALDMLLVAEHEGNLVGSAGLHPQLQSRRRHAAMLGITVVGEAQGRGVGRALMQALCDQADGWAGLLRIELSVFADNARAIALYERFGFVHEGRFRGYALRNGVYEDVLAMARWHPRPPVRREDGDLSDNAAS
ncbi:MAG: GNAT family N-acetyltransferase [Pseudomonadota bacterium]|nr:GNAT family N-acetyltransferase [Pseudomonadota bacterium]